METTTLDYLVAEHDFFGMTVENWVVIVAFIFLIWLLARYITPQNWFKVGRCVAYRMGAFC
jgi:Flp pilus assembly protein protease CpaA